MNKNQKVDQSQLLELVGHLSIKHNKLVIVFGCSSGQKINSSLGPTIDVNTELSQALLSIPIAKRPRNVTTLIGDMIHGLSSAYVCLVGLELLFEPSLQVSVVSLLKQLAHGNVIVALWPGEYIEGAAKLSYSKLGHPEYQDYTISMNDDFEVISYQNLIKDTE